MDTVEGVLVALPEIEGASAKRIVGTSAHTNSALQCTDLTQEFGLPLDHFSWRIPIRPFLLVADRRDAGPAEALPADADAIADGAAAALDQVEEMILRIDDDGARRFYRRVVNRTAHKTGIAAPSGSAG